MEVKVNALVLRATDYGENDKILTLLTAERGRITAGIKGVKKAGAKLKFAAQPFCFAEYVLAQRAGRYTVINASDTESFYDLRADITKFYAASAALEATLALTYEGDECAPVFYELIKTLSGMCAGDGREQLLRYLLFLLMQSGYGVSAGACSECGAPLTDKERLRFDMSAGAFTCHDCGTGVPVSSSTYNELCRLTGKRYDPARLAEDGQKRALRLLKEYFSYKTESPLKSLSEYIRLI